MYQYSKIYDAYFARYRRGIKGKLAKKTIESRIRKVVEKLDERDRHMIMLLSMYGTHRRVSLVEDKPIKKVIQQCDTALNHLITPTNVELVTGRNMFKHEGLSLGAYNLSTRTLNALRKKSHIETDGDLKQWLKYGSYQLFRLPGIGKGGLSELIPLMYKLK